MDWILENKDWLFSGVGISIFVFLINKTKKTASFQLGHVFYVLLFISGVIWLGLDYFLNFNEDWRLRLFIFGCTIIVVFAMYFLFPYISSFFDVKKAVQSLSLHDCEYVLDCDNKAKYVVFDFDMLHPLEPKWHNILYVPTGEQISLGTKYRIHVYSHALKLVKRKLKHLQVKYKGKTND